MSIENAEEIEECKALVYEAQEKILEAIEALEYAIRVLPNELYFSTYLLDHMKAMVTSEFASSDPNLDSVIAALNELLDAD